MQMIVKNYASSLVIGTCSLCPKDSSVISWNCSFLEEFWQSYESPFLNNKRYHFNSFYFNLGSITCTWHNANCVTIHSVEKNSEKQLMMNKFWWYMYVDFT